MRVVPEIRDVRVLAVAAATLVVNVLINVPVPAAILASIAVVVAFAVFRRFFPNPRPTSFQSTARFGGLSRREMEIAMLVGSLSNKEIAGRLFIAERTVDNHVQHIFNKLGVHTRAQIAVWASRLDSRASED